MRNDLDHLPPAKQQELLYVVRLLFDAFAEATARAQQPWKKAARILKLVLYGSYARGDWVDDPVGGYQSDYDILVVLNDERLTDMVEYWSAAEDRLMRDVQVTKTLSAPVGLIVHSLVDVNKELERGRPFFVDIARQGIALYESEGFEFSTPRTLPRDEAQAEARRYYAKWFKSARAFISMSKLAYSEDNLNESAFVLHQAAERLYHCTLLVMKLYSPKSHRLNFLRSHCEDIVPALIAAWPRDTKFARRCFELLRLAYVNARYSDQYVIGADELAWCIERVTDLQRIVQAVCRDYLDDPAL